MDRLKFCYYLELQTHDICQTDNIRSMNYSFCEAAFILPEQYNSGGSLTVAVEVNQTKTKPNQTHDCNSNKTLERSRPTVQVIIPLHASSIIFYLM